VRYQYAGTRAWALDGITLDVPAGSIHAVVGPNDAGKSTLALVVAGLAPLVIGGRLEGTVLLGGRATRDLRPHEAAQRCGALFQNPATQLSGTSPTVWEEVAFGPRNLGLELDEITDRVQSSLAALRIADLAPRDPTRVSGGQAQLVALATVLALRPPSLALDEPTSQLDPEGTRLVGAAIRRLADELGTAILLIEHKTGLLAHIADTGSVLDAGRTVAHGRIDEILDAPQLAELGVDPPPAIRLRRAVAASPIPEAQRERALGALADSATSDATADATSAVAKSDSGAFDR
jgi:energy-coupling factor transporter ATP-binding protein EcfA2